MSDEFSDQLFKRLEDLRGRAERSARTGTSSRWILPVIAQAPLTITGDREFGLGDLNPSFFFSPKKPTGGIIWGVGPTLLAPTGPIRLPSCSRWSLLFPWVRTP